MAVLEVLHFPDARLRTVAKPVETVDDSIRALVADMFDTMYDEEGIGLAATQVNRHIRLLVMDLSEERNEPMVFINPEVVEADGHQVYEEACLSVPGARAGVERAGHVKIKALNEKGEEFIWEAEGLHAVCIQHEMDHLVGKLFIDHLSAFKRRRIEEKLKKGKKGAK